MRFAICDDEKQFRQHIIDAIRQYSKQNNIYIDFDEFDNGFDLINSDKAYDIIFLDYQMDEINGLDTAKKLREKNNLSEIIFLTSYPQIVFDTFQVNTFRFLIKPLDFDKFKEALDNYRKNHVINECIVIKTNDSVLKVPIDSIIFAEAIDKYCNIHTADNTILYKKTLSELEGLLPQNIFYRSHRSYIVNFNHIVSHTNTDIKMDNNEVAMISKLKASAFKKSFLEYVKSTS